MCLVAIIYYLFIFIKTSFAWVTKLSVNTVFQFGPGDIIIIIIYYY